MTKIDKSTKRITVYSWQGDLIVELHPTWIAIRQKGKRFRYSITYDQLWRVGVENYATECAVIKILEERRRANEQARID